MRENAWLLGQALGRLAMMFMPAALGWSNMWGVALFIVAAMNIPTIPMGKAPRLGSSRSTE